MKNKILALALSLLMLMVFAGCGEDPVATVNGVEISQDTYEEYLNYMLTGYGVDGSTDISGMSDYLISSVIDSLVYTEELKQACEEKDCAPTEDELNAEMYEQLGVEDESSYKEAVSQIETYYGLSEETLIDVACSSLYSEKLGDVLAEEQEIDVTTEEAEEKYEEAPEEYDNRTVSHILIKPEVADGREAEEDESGNTIYTDEEWATAKAKAEDLIAQLNDGADFAELAEENSDDESTAESGGALGDSFTESSSTYVEEFTKASFKLTKEGQYTKKPVKSTYGYHIILCTGIQDVDNNYDDLIESIRTDLLDEAIDEAVSAYMDEFDENADVVIYYGSEANADEEESEEESSDDTEVDTETTSSDAELEEE